MRLVAPESRILVVDDEEPIRRLIVRLLEQPGYACTMAADAPSARKRLHEGRPFDLMLCDVTMPGESGLELVQEALRAYPEMAAIMVTGHDDTELAETALAIGAYGYVTKPFHANELLISVANALRRRTLELESRAHRDSLERTVAARTTELRETVGDLERSQVELHRYQEETIRRLAAAAELRDPETGRHIDRMSRSCGLLAERLGLDPAHAELLRVAAPMHDVGKIAIPDSILLKQGPLTLAERTVMEQHTTIGHEILAGSDAELLQLAAQLALTHHERYDGDGYPRRLEGEEIPIEGRIAAVADVFDALTMNRVYRSAFPVGEAIALMRQGSGSQFDPAVLECFLRHVDDVLAIRRTSDAAAA